MSTPQTIFKSPPQVQRVHLGRVIVPDVDHDGPVLQFGKRIEGQRRGLRAVSDDTPVAPKRITLDEKIGARVGDALIELNKFNLARDEGPYADKDGVVDAMVQALLPFVHNVGDMAVLAFDILRPRIPGEFGEKIESVYRRTLHDSDYMFMIDGDHVPPLELPTAGVILANPARNHDDVSGAEERVISHAAEVITLTVACLREIAAIRKMKVDIFPAFAISRNIDNPDIEEKNPVVAIIDSAGEVPLTTFSMMPIHPTVGSFDILSDEAVLGFAHGLLAHNHVKQFSVTLAAAVESGHELSQDAIEAIATTAGYHIAQFHAHLPGDMVQERMGGIQQTLDATFMSVNMAIAQVTWEEKIVEASRQLEANLIKGKKAARVEVLKSEEVAKKKSGMLGWAKSGKLDTEELRAIGAQVEKEFADHQFSGEERLAIGEQARRIVGPELQIADAVMHGLIEGAEPDQRLSFQLVHEAYQETGNAVGMFMQGIMVSMARELTKMGISLAEEFEGKPENDLE